MANSQTIAVLLTLSTDIMYYLLFTTLLVICYLSSCIRKKNGMQKSEQGIFPP